MHSSCNYRSSLALLALALLLANGCRTRAPIATDEVEPVQQGEPEEYSATIARTVDGVEVSLTRIARVGEMRREEWSEQGRQRALISRPDIGKAFLLDLDKQIYVELDLGSGVASQSVIGSSSKSTARDDESSVRPSAPEPGTLEPDALERALDDAPSPSRLEAHALADQTIENRACKVIEQRAIFDDGHIEITRIFCARDLDDLAVRIETESEGGVKVVTERRDVKTTVAPDQFVVPAGFKKVERLAQ
ncbi:MAG: hypothetical protein WBV94_14335 [Blastocatellia bacterium]